MALPSWEFPIRVSKNRSFGGAAMAAEAVGGLNVAMGPADGERRRGLTAPAGRRAARGSKNASFLGLYGTYWQLPSGVILQMKLLYVYLAHVERHR
ncbi:hypothetical protein EVAR_44850_1 [Eumeta japonica]|uniref:Uncharacterized protein n=1 Tax=Eumeta variegata TaxID=151549 RepID=A0A4C1YIX3_EUMVA|nr:hypothetical protein EVAR_44850_1 [Eumeta japonica]